MAKLADLLAEQHSDPWMKDFLKASRPDQREAARALSEALTANRRGFYDAALGRARVAVSGFLQNGNIPGQLRAQLEAVYAEQRRLKGQKCIALADELRRKLTATNYRWSQGQLALEDATCSNLKAQLDVVDETLAANRRITEECHFTVLGLRMMALDAGFKRQRHRYEESWQEIREGVGRYYQGIFPAERLYNFYSVMEQYAGEEGLLHAQRALLSEAIALRESDPPEDANLILTATLYLRLANSFAVSKDTALAAAATEKANALFDEVPREPFAASYVLHAKIDAAAGQLSLGHPDLALATLEPSLGLAPAIEFDFMFLDFNRVLGDSYRQARRFDDAARAYEKSIVTAERTLNSLDSVPDKQHWMSGTEQLYRGLVLDFLEQDRVVEALQLWEWSRDRIQRQGPLRAEFDWNDIKKEIFKPLPLDSQPRLIYVALQDRLQIWIVREKQIKSKSIFVKQDELEAQVNQFAKECWSSASDLNEVREHSRKLGALFLGTIFSELPESLPVEIELDPRLSRLPLSALLGPGDTYLDEQHPFILSPGIVAEGHLRPPKVMDKGESVLLADASPPSGRNHLPDHELLTNAISELFPGTRVEIPSKAGWPTLSRELGRRTLFTFIGHGVRDGAGTVLIYGNSRLSAKDFSRAPLHHLDLAVLIACSSGAGGEGGLFGTDNLVRPFLSAGVPSIVASRWDVDSRTTVRLMEAFHRHLASGATPSLALSLARKQIRQGKPHPYYWASFDLDGRAN